MRGIVSSLALVLPAAYAGIIEIEDMLLQAENDTMSMSLGRSMFDVNNPLFASLDAIWGYGCWCYFQDEHGQGQGAAQNFVDRHCQILHHGYSCIKMDAADENDPDCEPFVEDYNTIQVLGNNEFALEADCEAKNAGNNCAIRSCAVESFFVLNIFNDFFSGKLFDPSLKHDLGQFDPFDVCPRNAPKDNSPWECCGDYPKRFPYKTRMGQRACCGQNTYDTTVLMCCGGDNISASC